MKNLYCGAWSFKMPVSGISAFSLQDGQWEKLGCFGAEIPAQSILAAQGGTLLSVSERRDGGSLLRYRIAEDGALSLIGRLDFDTPLMSYVCLSPDGRYAFTSSMGNSSVKMIRLESAIFFFFCQLKCINKSKPRGFNTRRGRNKRVQLSLGNQLQHCALAQQRK